MMRRGWHASTWSYEHARYGHFFIQVNRDGSCLASRVDHKTISTIDRAEGTDLPYPLHASLSAAMLACERRIEELDALTTAVEAEDERAHLGERVAALRLVRP